MKFGNELSVAFDHPDLEVIDFVRDVSGCDVATHIAASVQIRENLDIHCSQHLFESTVAAALDKNPPLAESNEVMDLSRSILVDALRQRASDIHTEPDADILRVRYRIDGLLREQHRLPLRLGKALTARFKIMANLDISETRRPQDGCIRFALNDLSVDVRISVAPGLHGEKTVLRILDRRGVGLNLDSMAFSRDVRHAVDKMVAAPNGIILITGPTGSGKTTTCYAMLNHLNTLERNIVTIEDPIEYRLPLINQIQVHHEIGLDFAQIFRSVLRQDPDTILVGEIRDTETARIAAEAALTGHLVLATLHTNDAVQAVLRLQEMGVPPYTVAPALSAIVGQRLARRICVHCRTEHAPDDTERNILPPGSDDSSLKLFHGNGCKHCSHTGFSGRIALHEVISISPPIRELMLESAPLHKITQAARLDGYRSMRHDGLKKALMGLTTLNEVDRVTPEALCSRKATTTSAPRTMPTPLTPHLSSEALPSTIPVLDQDELMERIGYDETLLREVIDLFLQDVPVQMNEISAALKANNMDALRRAAHAIKGTSGNLSGKRVFDIASKIETDAIQGTVQSLPEDVEALCQHVDALNSALVILRKPTSTIPATAA